MALLYSSLSLVPSKTPPLSRLRLSPPPSLSFSLYPHPKPLTFITLSATGPPSGIADEWGEKGSKPEPEPESKLPDLDPPVNDDEWEGTTSGNGSLESESTSKFAELDRSLEGNDEVEGLKRCLVDTVYGSDLGLRASVETRAEVTELVSQLEAVNPTPAPTEAKEVLEGKWVLVYTAASELLPLLALGTTPLLKVEKITQAISISTSTIDNSITLTSPFASFSFSASANFTVQTPSRIEVEFKEGSFQPPEIKTSIDLPENVNIFGQTINLSPVQQSLNPLQDAVATIARTISGQPPLKLGIPGERTKSWLLTTYLDKDLRISRGDGGLFVLVKEGSSLLDQ